MKKLIKGIVEFREKSLAEYREKFSKLAAGQSPDTLFIACCDSRVVPNVFASTDPGDLFVVRNIGNLVPPYENFQGHLSDASVGAAIAFSVLALNVSDIVVCGHSDCGAMRAVMEKNLQIENIFLNNWLKYALPSYEKFKEISHTHQHEHHHLMLHDQLSQINVLQQLEHLKTYPEIKTKMEKNNLRIHAWWFDLATADVYHHETAKDKFILIDAEEAKRML